MPTLIRVGKLNKSSKVDKNDKITAKERQDYKESKISQYSSRPKSFDSLFKHSSLTYDEYKRAVRSCLKIS